MEHGCQSLSRAWFSCILQAMPDEPRKIFDLMDTETEPTDEQLAELMHYVGEAVRAKKKAAGLPLQESAQSVSEFPAQSYGT